ncbi:MAG: hypothetical protein KDM91_10270, partial [Verrucomicrobiae bacterium]|nr:hypothetical protein [Verrucomicrobiae bacterium]
IMAVAVSPDGATVAAGRGGEIAFFELAATADEKSPPSLKAAGAIDAGRDAVQALAWAPDGKTLAAGGFRRVLLIDTATRQVRTEIRTDLAGRITALAFSNDSKTLFAADSIPAAAGRLHFIGAASGKIDASLRAHGDTIFDLDVSPDGKMLASASADKLVRIWDLATRERVTTLEGHTGYVLACAFSPESGRLASAGDDEVIKIWNLGTAKQEAAFGDTGVSAGPITGLAWTTDPANAEKKAAEKDAEKAKAINTDRLVAVNEAGKPKIYNELKDHEGEQRSTGAREKAAEEAGDLLTAVALDPKSQRFFAGSATGLIRMWSADGKLIATLPEPAKIAEAPTNP